MSNDSLKSLHTALVDARSGYEKALEETEDARLAEQLRAADDLHRAAHADIHRLLAGRGETADDEGSFMGTVHRTVVAARSAIVGLDAGALDSFASGEENNLESYDEAIRDEADAGARRALEEHRGKLAARIEQMKQAAKAA